MQRFGTNPFGENRYRLVLASSRRHICHGRWNEAGLARAKWVPTYAHLPSEDYVLEEWLSAFQYTGMTPSQWNADPAMLSLGPYPHRGEYTMIGQSGFNPAQVNVEKLIQLVHGADRFSWSEKLNACRSAAEKVEADTKALRESIIRDALPAFGHAAFSAYGGGGGEKKSPVIRSANELGLPITQGVPGQVTTGGPIVRKKKRKAA